MADDTYDQKEMPSIPFLLHWHQLGNVCPVAPSFLFSQVLPAVPVYSLLRLFQNAPHLLGFELFFLQAGLHPVYFLLLEFPPVCQDQQGSSYLFFQSFSRVTPPAMATALLAVVNLHRKLDSLFI